MPAIRDRDANFVKVYCYFLRSSGPVGRCDSVSYHLLPDGLSPRSEEGRGLISQEMEVAGWQFVTLNEDEKVMVCPRCRRRLRDEELDIERIVVRLEW